MVIYKTAYMCWSVTVIFLSRDAYIICCVDTMTSVFAGFVIFSILGVMAKEAGTGVENVVESS